MGSQSRLVRLSRPVAKPDLERLQTLHGAVGKRALQLKLGSFGSRSVPKYLGTVKLLFLAKKSETSQPKTPAAVGVVSVGSRGKASWRRYCTGD